ncbi:MAG TPA: hypothetical protein DDX85_08760 [Nitrospiraceae bacterium]|nr:hypothetical protein [Nitrospiraceae bacterium]
MDDIVTRIIENLADRVSGPMKFRLILQPLMATIFAIRDGRKDAREGKAPYAWAVFTNPEHRRELLQDGWKAVGKVFVIAVIIDVIYQFVVLKWVYPVEALIVAALLAFIPYLVIRGPVNRLISRKGKEDL